MPAFRDENTPMNTQAEERILIEVAKQEHRETTAAAERALQVRDVVCPPSSRVVCPRPRGPAVGHRSVKYGAFSVHR